MWLKRQFLSDGFGTASVFETFREHCIALGMPLEMLMVEERSRDGSGATIWIRLPASERAAYREFGGSAREWASEESHPADRPQ
jgi:hypothetical protein